MAHPQDHTRSAFHLNKTEVLDILNAVKNRGTMRQPVLVEKRKHHRFKPTEHDALALFEHPGGSTDSCHALLFDISAAGVGLAVRGFLHIGTHITVQLKTNDGEQRTITGTVRWCDYFDRQVHLVGVALHEHLDPRNFTTEDEWVKYSITNDDTAWMKDRSALVIDADQLEFNITKMFLKNANVVAHKAESIGAALDSVQNGLFDVILLNDALDESLPTTQTLQKLKSHGHSGPIIVYTTSIDPNDAALKAAGASAVLQHPIELAHFLAVLRDVFENASDPMSGTDPILSTLSPDHCSKEFLEEYIFMITQTAQRLDLAIHNDDYPAALKLCNSLYSTGAGYGFPLLSATALKVIKALNASCSPLESAPDIRQLIHLVRRLKARTHEDRVG